jgi:hypothetical protein
MAGLRDPFRYREGAAHFRQLAVAATDSASLRDSYLALAIEFEWLANTLERGPKTGVHGGKTRSES